MKSVPIITASLLPSLASHLAALELRWEEASTDSEIRTYLRNQTTWGTQLVSGELSVKCGWEAKEGQSPEKAISVNGLGGKPVRGLSGAVRQIIQDAAMGAAVWGDAPSFDSVPVGDCGNLRMSLGGYVHACDVLL